MASADGQTEFIDPAFPRGTREKFVEAGTLLGYQGTWWGAPTLWRYIFTFLLSKQLLAVGMKTRRSSQTPMIRPIFGIEEVVTGFCGAAR